MTTKKFGRYEIIREIGRGGMATVFLALDPRFQREVAIKVLPRQFTHDPQFRVRFEREAQIIAHLDHSAIVPVFDYGEEEEQPYLVMRFMPGGSLADRLKEGPIPLPETGKILVRIASALDRAHGINIVHRDLKPANILFDQYGDAFLADFGIVKVAQATSTLTGSAILGTPAYMSPEQVQGTPVDAKSDIYTLGVILFEMLTGRQPYEADTPMGMAVKHIIDPVPRLLDSRQDLPASLDDTISRAMAKEADKRFSTASDLAAQVNAELLGPLPGAQAEGQMDSRLVTLVDEMVEEDEISLSAAPPPAAVQPAESASEDSLTKLVDTDERPLGPPPAEPVPQRTAAPRPSPPRTRLAAARSSVRPQNFAQVPYWIWGIVVIFLIGVLYLGSRLLSSTTHVTAEPGLSVSGYIADNWGNGYRVTNLTYGDGLWSVLMSQGSPFGRQRWQTLREFPADYIAQGWEEGFRVTELAYGEGVWAVSISRDTPYGRQIWTTAREFPTDYILNGWENDFRITDVEYGNGVWGLILSQGSAYGRQIWQASHDFPIEYILAGWEEGFRITEMAYGNGLWAVVMSQDSPYGQQIWTTSQEFPIEYIFANWEEGFRVTELMYGDGVWAVVMSQGSPFDRQVWQNSRDFTPDE